MTLVRAGALLVALSAATLSACDDDASTSDGTSGPGSGSTASGGAGPGGGGAGGDGVGGSTGGAGGGGGEITPYCARMCSTPADCPKPGANPPFDGDNWTCDGGLCNWLGCLSDDECAFFGGVCRPGGTVTGDIDACTEGCVDVSECVENLQSVDLDNWACTGGACKYTGCLSDEECVADFGAGSICPTRADRPPICVHGCMQAADCVVMGSPVTHDADNWSCRMGLCKYYGCLSDEECITANGDGMVCVTN